MTSNYNSNNVEKSSSVGVAASMVKDYQKIMFSGKLVYGSTPLAKQRVQTDFVDAKGYIFDMTNLTYIDSTGLGMLMSLAKQVHLKEKKIVIVITDNFIKEIFYIAKFNLVFTIVDSEAKAIEVLENNEKTLLSIDEY